MEKANKTLNSLLDSIERQPSFNKVLKKHAELVESIQKRLKEIKNSMDLVNRKNQQLRLDIERICLQRERKSTEFSKLANEGLELSRTLVARENEYDKQMEESVVLKDTIKRLQALETSLNFPSQNKLFLEVVRGLGVDLIDQNDKQLFSIRGKTSFNNIDITDTTPSVDIWKILDE